MGTAVSKETARKEAVKKRISMDKAIWKKDSLVIQKAVINSVLFKDAEEILVYADIKKEVCTSLIIETALKLGKKVALPKSYDDGIMKFFYIKSKEDLIIGKYNILEPPDTFECVGKKGLMIMPGTAFDRNGNRSGYGAGYYDRYLSDHRNLNTAAICFSFQLYDKITYNKHDIKPDMIFTEKEKIYVK